MVSLNAGRARDGAGHEYWLTPAGEGLRAVMDALGQWGMTYTHDRIKRSDLDPALLIWGLRKRVDLSALPDRRVVLRFEFSGVPASRTKFRIMWLILGRSGVDVCMKDPGFAVDLTLRGNIRDYVEVYLGHTKWRDVAGTALQLDGDLQIARAFPVWLRFETVNGLNAPAPHLSAGPAPVQTDHSDRLPSRPAECGLEFENKIAELNSSRHVEGVGQRLTKPAKVPVLRRP